MGLFGENKNKLKCKKCGTVLSDSERLKKHQEIALTRKKKNAGFVEQNLILKKI